MFGNGGTMTLFLLTVRQSHLGVSTWASQKLLAYSEKVLLTDNFKRCCCVGINYRKVVCCNISIFSCCKGRRKKDGEETDIYGNELVLRKGQKERWRGNRYLGEWPGAKDGAGNLGKWAAAKDGAGYVGEWAGAMEWEGYLGEWPGGKEWEGYLGEWASAKEGAGGISRGMSWC